MIEAKVIFWVAVALTASSGVAATVLAARRHNSAATARVADRLAQIALLGASALILLLGQH
jgi:hypothetical protein